MMWIAKMLVQSQLWIGKDKPFTILWMELTLFGQKHSGLWTETGKLIHFPMRFRIVWYRNDTKKGQTACTAYPILFRTNVTLYQY